VEFQALVVKGNINAVGQISCVKKAPCEWGRKERPPRFEIVAINLTSKHSAECVQRECRYDFSQEQFVFKESGEVFKESDLIKKKEFDEASGNLRNAALVSKVASGNVENPCLYLYPDYGWAKTGEDFNEAKKYWLRKIFPFRNLPGIAEVRESIKYGYYCDVADSFNALPAVTQQKFWSEVSFTNEDIKYLKEKLLVKSNWLKDK